MMVKKLLYPRRFDKKTLEKLGFTHMADVSYESLALIYQRWCQKIPFDNIMKRIHMELNMHRFLPGSYPKDFFENWIAATGAGRTCWAGNGSFYALPNSFGFPAQLGVSIMISLSNSDVKNLHRHGTVIVNFGSRISEAKFREILRLFCRDVEAKKVAENTRVSSSTINKIFDRLRERIAEHWGFCKVRLSMCRVIHKYNLLLPFERM